MFQFYQVGVRYIGQSLSSVKWQNWSGRADKGQSRGGVGVLARGQSRGGVGVRDKGQSWGGVEVLDKGQNRSGAGG
jgi:hypothetical protein